MSAFISFDNNTTFYNVDNIASFRQVNFPAQTKITLLDGDIFTVNETAIQVLTRIKAAQNRQ